MSVESERGAVEGNGLNGGIDVVSTGNSMRRKQCVGSELTAVLHTSKDGGDVVLGFWDETVRSRGGCVGATEQEFQARSTDGAVGECGGTSELDQVTSSDLRVSSEERQKSVDGVRNTEVGREKLSSTLGSWGRRA